MGENEGSHVFIEIAVVNINRIRFFFVAIIVIILHTITVPSIPYINLSVYQSIAIDFRFRRQNFMQEEEFGTDLKKMEKFCRR